VIVVTRFNVSAEEAPDFEAHARELLTLLSTRPGFQGARLARSADEPTLWAMTTEWDSAGTWRRSLSGNDAKLLAIPLLSRAIDEATVYEPLLSIHADGSQTQGESLRAEGSRIE
jgi:quinol monooxygenase YgiN